MASLLLKKLFKSPFFMYSMIQRRGFSLMDTPITSTTFGCFKEPVISRIYMVPITVIT